MKLHAISGTVRRQEPSTERPAHPATDRGCRRGCRAGAHAAIWSLARVAGAPAAADFRICNNTGSRVGVAVGYKDSEQLDHRRLVEPVGAHLRDPAAGHAGRALLLHLRDRLRPRRRMVGPGLHVHARQGVHHPAAPRIAWRAASTAPASSRSTPASSASGRCSSPRPATRRRSSRCNRACRRRLALAGPAERSPQHRREARTDETPAPHQDRRHARPRLLRRGDDRRAVRGRRRRLPHQHEPHAARAHARAGRGDPRGREASTTGRSASWSICRARSCASAPSPAARSCSTNGATFTLDADTSARRRHARAPAASGNLRGRRSPATRCCSTTARSGSSRPRSTADRIVTRVEVGGKLSDRKGVSLPDTDDPVLGAGAEGPLRSRSRARRRHRLGRRCRSSSGRTTSPKPRRSRAAAPR